MNIHWSLALMAFLFKVNASVDMPRAYAVKAFTKRAFILDIFTIFCDKLILCLIL
jgi:hypothetical protein